MGSHDLKDGIGYQGSCQGARAVEERRAHLLIIRTYYLP